MRVDGRHHLSHVVAGKWWLILRDTTRESVMILMIIAAAVLFGYMLTSLYLTQTLAQAIAEAHVNKWVLMVADQPVPAGVRLLHPAGGDHPDDVADPVPIITAAGFDPVWFGVIMTINMEIGLIHPPVGLNIYIVNSIAPDVPVTRSCGGRFPTSYA